MTLKTQEKILIQVQCTSLCWNSLKGYIRVSQPVTVVRATVLPGSCEQLSSAAAAAVAAAACAGN